VGDNSVCYVSYILVFIWTGFVWFVICTFGRAYEHGNEPNGRNGRSFHDHLKGHLLVSKELAHEVK
jgi:hypothetical protein